MSNEINNESLDNKELISLLLDFNQSQSGEMYTKIVASLQADNHILLLPSINDTDSTNDWRELHGGSELKLNCIFNVNGIKVLAAFTSESAMNSWAKSSISYTAIKSSDVMKMSLQWDVDRIVIDSDQASMFVLQKSQSNGKSTLPDKSVDFIAFPPLPLKPHNVASLAAHFLQIAFILEAFQFTFSNRSESSLVIGLKLSEYTSQSKEDCFIAVKEAFELFKAEVPIDVIFLENEAWYRKVISLNHSMFYRKPNVI